MRYTIIRSAVSLLTCFALGQQAASAEITYVDADLQSAIEASSPGDVLLVESGVYLPICIHHSLTIIAVNGPVRIVDNAPFETRPSIDIGVGGPGPTYVRLVGIENRTYNGEIGQSPIEASSLGRLELIDCDLEVITAHPGPTAFDGKPAVETTAPLIYVADSRLIGGAARSGNGLLSNGQQALDYSMPGSPAVRKTWDGGDLIVRDSLLRGGAASGGIVYTSEAGVDCGSFDPGTNGMHGGFAVWVGRTFEQNSQLEGGTGVLYRCCDGLPPAPYAPGTCAPNEMTVLGYGPDGPKTTGVLAAAPALVTAPHRVSLGAQYTANFELASSPGFVILGTGLHAPMELTGIGTLFVGGDGSPFVVLPLGPGPTELTHEVAQATQLIGQTIALQAWDGTQLGSPHLTVIVP